MFTTALLGMAFSALSASPVQSLDRANELLSEARFDEAAAMYRSLTDADPSDGASWYGLSRSLHEGGQNEEAAAAYEKTLELGANLGRTLYHYARLAAANGDSSKAIELLRRTQTDGVFLPYQILMGTSEFEPLKSDAAFQELANALKPCTAPEYRHFDFWIGEWEVEAPNGQPAGTNRIARIQGDCALHEQWTSAGGGTGTSFSTYNTTKKKWQQFWVDAQGTVLEIEGGLENGAMVMRSNPDASPVNRITWTPNDDGSVRQHWETSADGGATWTTAFDGTYRKKK